MPRLSGILDDHAQRSFALCHDGYIEGHLPTYQAAYDALDSFAHQALTRPGHAGAHPFWDLQNGNTRGDPITEAAAIALFHQAFGPTFTADHRVVYACVYGFAWLALFSYQGCAIELCFNAADIWRVSLADRCDSVPFIHTDRPLLLCTRLREALDRLIHYA